MCDTNATQSCLLWRILLLLCVLASAIHRSFACPKSCACYAPTEVHCTFRYLTEIPRDIQPAVERINLGYNSLTTLRVNDFSGLKKLELLMLHSNTIKIIEDMTFHDLKSLQVLKISYNRVEKLTKDTFRDLENLVRLHMDHNHITFIHPETFYGLKMLQLVNLEGNLIQQLHPDTFISLRYNQIFKFSSLKTIYLSDNALTTLPETVFAGCYKIENLFLSGNPWSCDCRMRWLAEWIEKKPGILKCKRDRKFAKEQLCPVCEFPVSSRGSSIQHLPIDGYTCIRPWIYHRVKQRNFTMGDGDYTSVSSKDFVAPIGMLEMNITDHLHNDASIVCVVQRPTEMENLTVIYGVNGKDVTALRATVATSLICSIDYDHIRQVWNILATYSDSPLRLERGSLLSLQPNTVYTYKQMVPTADEVFTETEAKIKANPAWLMQGIINLQLDRFTSTFPTLNIKYSSNVQIDVDSSMDSNNQYNWAMIRRDNQTKTEYSVLFGGAIELNCQIFGDPKPIVEWILPDGSKVRAPYDSEDQRIVVTTKGKLVLKSAESSDTGVYYCIATNYLDADVLAFRVTVLTQDIEEEEVNGVQVSHTIGQNLVLNCTSAGSPKSSIQWILPDHTVLDKTYGNKKLYENGTLAIYGLTYRDRGFYRCLASNYLGADVLASQVTVYDDFKNNTKPTIVKESAHDVVEIIDDGQKLHSRDHPHPVSEESRSITSDRPYTWLKSRFHKVPTGRGGYRRNSKWARRVFNEQSKKVDAEKIITLIKNSQNKGRSEDGGVSLSDTSKTIKELPDDIDTTSGDGISEDEFIVMTTTRTLDHKTLNTIKPTDLKGTDIKTVMMTTNSKHSQNNPFMEVETNNANNIRTTEKSNLVTEAMYSYKEQTDATPIMSSFTLSNYEIQKDETTNSEYMLSHSDGETYAHERGTHKPLGQPVTTDKMDLLFSGDSEEVATEATTQYNFQNPNITHLDRTEKLAPRVPHVHTSIEPESDTIFTAVTTTEREHDKITFQTTQKIESPHLLPGSTIISKHQIHIVPPKKKQSGKRRNFHGKRRIIRPNRITDIQSLLDKFNRLSVNNKDNLTLPHTTDKVTDCGGMSTENCETTVYRRLNTPTSSLRVTEKPVTLLSTSEKTCTVTDSQMSETMEGLMSKKSSDYITSTGAKEKEQPKNTIISTSITSTTTTTKSSKMTRGKIPRHRQLRRKGDQSSGSLSRLQNPFMPTTTEHQMTSTAEPDRATTAASTTEVQFPHIVFSPPSTKEYNTPETSYDDSSGSSYFKESNSSYEVITLSTTADFFSFPVFHEHSTSTEPIPVSRALPAPPTTRTEQKQDTSQFIFSGSEKGKSVLFSRKVWRNQKPGSRRRGFRGRGSIKKATSQSPNTTVTKIMDKDATTKSTTLASQNEHTSVVIRPLHTPFKEVERSPSTTTANSDKEEWRRSTMTSSIPEVITITSKPTTDYQTIYRKPTISGLYTTSPSQIYSKANADRMKTNVRPTPKRGWGYTQKPVIRRVQPTVFDEKYRECFECPKPTASSGIPHSKSKKKTVISDSIVLTGEQNYTFPPLPHKYDHSTGYDTSNAIGFESSSTDVISKPRIIGGKAASFTVLSHSDAFLPCEATGSPEPTISWSRFFSATGGMTNIKGKMGKFEVLKNGTLFIQKTSVKDHGQYICIAENKYGSDKLVVTLSVVAYPTQILEQKIREIKVLTGKSVKMECKTEGRPVPIVSWILPNRTEVKGPNTKHDRVTVTSMGTLIIQEVSVYDRGHYKCIASNPAGTDTATVRLQVIAAPPVILEEKQQLVRADVGQNLLLPCTTRGDPKPTTHWVLHDGTVVWPLTDSHYKIFAFLNGTLYLKNLEITESGKYECIATSSTGSERRMVTLSVERTETAPQIIETSERRTDVIYGGRLQLNCSAIGDPKPKIIWRLPSKALVDQSHRMGSRMKVLENGTLIIESINEKDGGDYLCVARSKVGDDIQLMRVSVSMKPAQIKPNGFSKQQVPYGNDLKVDCVAAGVPMPEISWGLPDGTLVNSALQADGAGGDQSKRYILFNNGTLFLNKVGIDEEGDYTCYAENKLGKDKMHVHITVVAAAPRIQPPDLTYARVRPGGNVRFDCKAIGEPKPKIFWMLPSNDMIAASNERYLVHANGSLDIRNVKLPDAGEYVCMARNTAGDENKVYKLDIDGNPPIINGFSQNRTVMKDTAVKYSRKLIDCKAEGQPPPKITWIMPDNIFLKAPYYGSRINVHRNGTLEIRNVRPTDTAEFICMAQNDGGEAVMLIQLEVIDMLMRPIFKNPFNERVVARAGSTTVLNCSADGQPSPEMIWTLPNKTRFSGEPDKDSRYHLGKDGIFKIYNSSKEDAGKYRCGAKNKAGYIEKLVVLEVIQKPYILTRPRGIIRSVLGEPLFLHCLTDGSQPSISWAMPGGHILARPQVNGRYHLMENGTLVIRETSLHDRGNYVCRARNNAGEALLSVPVIILAFPPRITNGPPPNVGVMAGVTIHLKCIANGIPKPEITWELPDRFVFSTSGKGQTVGSELLHSQGTLIIQKPTRADSGNYKCIAINNLGRDTRTTYIRII